MMKSVMPWRYSHAFQLCWGWVHCQCSVSWFWLICFFAFEVSPWHGNCEVWAFQRNGITCWRSMVDVHYSMCGFTYGFNKGFSTHQVWSHNCPFSLVYARKCRLLQALGNWTFALLCDFQSISIVNWIIRLSGESHSLKHRHMLCFPNFGSH